MSTDKEVLVGKYKVKVIRDLCIGAASCVALSPTVFDLDEEGKAIIVATPDDTPENIVMAAQSCPVKAVIVVDSETGEQVWPK